MQNLPVLGRSDAPGTVARDVPGLEGRELDQDADDTVKQAFGKDDDDNEGDATA